MHPIVFAYSSMDATERHWRSRFGEEMPVPSLSDQKRFKRRERLSLAAANAARGDGWRLILAETTILYDRLAERRSAEDNAERSRDTLAAWANQGGSK